MTRSNFGYRSIQDPNSGQVPAGSISNTELASGIDAVKLADGSVTNTEFQYINSLSSNAQTQFNALPASYGELIYVSTTEASIANTTDETTLWQFEVPAASIGASGLLVFDTWNEVLNNSGGNRTIQYKLKYDDTTVADSTSGQMVASGTPNQFYMDGYMKNVGATNSQQGAIRYSIDNRGLCYGDSGTAAEDSTGALNLTLTGKFAFAHASLTCTMRWVTIRVVKL